MDCCAVRAMGTKYSGHLLSVVIENNYQPRRPEGHTITVAQPVTRHNLGPALVYGIESALPGIIHSSSIEGSVIRLDYSSLLHHSRKIDRAT